jgi:Spy/CpxP family protein refolding chaperone
MRSKVQKIGLRVAVLVCGAGLAVASAAAQDGPPPPPQDGQQQGPPPGSRGGMRGGNPEMRAKMLQRQLGLTDDVTMQVKAIFIDGTSKMEALRSGSASPEELRPQMMAIHKAEAAKVSALLTPDQQAKYAEMEARRGPRGGGPPPDGGTPPPPPPQ